ncbi:MAG: thiamine-phosphate kinase [Cyanobacteriota bacterium]
MINEHHVIELAKKYFRENNKNIIKGIGDDTAVLLNTGKYMLFTSDMLIDKTHFLLDKIFPYDLGWKALVVNISDIAGMGGSPEYAVLSIGLTKETNYSWLENFYLGLSDCANTYQLSIVGGDTILSDSNLVINIALTGSCNKPIYRNNIKSDYILTSTGFLGLSALGLDLILNKKEPFNENEQYFINKHYKPIPRIKEGLFFSENIKDFAMMDSSDGLYTSLKTMCEQTNLGFEIYKEDYLICNKLQEQANLSKKSYWDFFIYGGEDYELIVAMSEKDFFNIKDKYKTIFNSNLEIIGKFNNINNNISLKEKESSLILTDKSFHHFS